MSESGCARMTMNGSGLEWVLAQFSIAPGKLIRYVRHIDMKYTEKMGLMWLNISHSWWECSANKWDWVKNKSKWVGMGGSGLDWVGLDGTGWDWLGVNGSRWQCMGVGWSTVYTTHFLIVQQILFVELTLNQYFILFLYLNQLLLIYNKF